MIPPLTLLGRHAVITGASGSLGVAISRTLAAQGATLSLLGRRSEPLQSLVSSLPTQSTATPHEIHLVDVADGPAFKNAVAEITKGQRPVDILINAAGVAQNRLLSGLDEEEIGALVGTNLTASILGCKYFGKALMRASKNNGDAVIVNVSSLLAVTGGRGASVYAATKAGVLGLTRSLAAELAPRIRVNALLPGYIQSKMVEEIVPNTSDALTKKIPLARYGTPQEVAHATLFLVENRYANNCVLNLDGGLSVGQV